MPRVNSKRPAASDSHRSGIGFTGRKEACGPSVSRFAGALDIEGRAVLCLTGGLVELVAKREQRTWLQHRSVCRQLGSSIQCNDRQLIHTECECERRASQPAIQAEGDRVVRGTVCILEPGPVACLAACGRAAEAEVRGPTASFSARTMQVSSQVQVDDEGDDDRTAAE